jgi:hypothetical protein
MNTSDIKRAQNLSQRLSDILGPQPKKVLVPKKTNTVYGLNNGRLEKKVYYGNPGKDGKNADEDTIVKRVLEAIVHMIQIPEVPSMEQIVTHIKENKVLEAKDVKGIPVDANGGFRMDDLRWHGSGGASSSAVTALIVTDVFSATNGQTVFSSSTNMSTILSFSIGGAIQTPTTDYANTATNATVTAGSWPGGVPGGLAVVLVYIKA